MVRIGELAAQVGVTVPTVRFYERRRLLPGRWVAIRHADDHVHVVATLARVDGKRPSIHNDRVLSRKACNYFEAKYGLIPTSSGQGTAAKHPTQSETRKAPPRVGRSAARGAGLRRRREPARLVLRRRVRSAAAAADDLDDFFARLRADGVPVRPRLSERNPGQVTGYAVALTGDTDRDGNPIYFGGGKLAADLTLPKLQRRWAAAAADAARPRPESTDQTGRPAAAEEPPPAAGRRVLSDAARAQVWEHAIAAAARATRQVMAAALTDPDAAGDAAWIDVTSVWKRSGLGPATASKERKCTSGHKSARQVVPALRSDQDGRRGAGHR